MTHTLSPALSPYTAAQVAARPIEARVIRRIVAALDANGTPVTHVNDGGDRVRVSSRNDVLETAFSVDSCHLITAAGSWVYLVMGQDWDTVADYTTDLEEAIGPVLDWINAND